MTYDEIIELALALPDTEESLSWRRPSIKRKGRFMVCYCEEGVMSVKLDWPNRDRLLDENPDVIYIIPHFYGWPGFLVKLGVLNPDLASEAVRRSYEDAPKPTKMREAP